MQTNLEQIKQAVLHLPTEDFERFDEWYETEKRKRPKNAEKEKLKKYQIERFQKAQEWVSKNREKYMNEWVCLEGDRLVAHGADALEVHRQAKEAGIEIPYLEHIVEESDWGGW
jgi:alpha-D-ribose 1-methylphosphonate 5-triphosphate diphosphatase PhnM